MSSSIPGLDRFFDERVALLPGSKHSVDRATIDGTDHFVVLNEFSPDSGGQLLLKIDRDGATEILALDSTIDPMASLVPERVAAALRPSTHIAVSYSFREPEWIIEARRAAPAYTGGGLQAIMLHWARAADDKLDTSTAPGTEGGNLACAWAINKLAALAFGREIGGTTSTVNMHKSLRANHGPPSGTPRAGDIIISPTSPKFHGHVGIVGGSLAGPVTEADNIYSNSSTAARFLHVYTLDSWRRKYVDRYHLAMEYFQLNPAAFGLTASADVRVVNALTQLRTETGDRVIHAGTRVAVIRDEPGGLSYVAVLPEQIVTGRILTSRLSPAPNA